jgi:hypothetical protein
VLNLVPIVGKFRTLVFDPAWDYDWLSLAARAKPGYAMQTDEQLRALDLESEKSRRCGLENERAESGASYHTLAGW